MSNYSRILLKTRPNDRNISTQHCWAQHAAHVWPPVARVATCCVLLSQVWKWSYLSQQHPIVTIRRNRVARRAQRVVCCSQQCYDMFRWNVAIVWSGLKLSNIKSFKMALFSISQSVRRYTVIMKTWKLVSTSLACCSVQRAWLWLGYCLTVSRFKFSFVPWPVDCSSRGLHKLNEHLQLKGTESI